ncbi:MAG TPA: hypothetical protein DF712_14375 [Balneola sp.]|jgi:hypothetical protein|nr:hypothetical protein [Bacteroidota bacterium]HCI71273.1 hypothetical protein [Balneola sp.]HCT53635.1 hypothetical protein [Balneola sp.]|tara:strand:+ start:751 stop:1026 length:276 start_codon:yes stop_codon:yes gene_type:complete
MAKKDKDIVWFGMKLTPEEKQKIELLAEKKGISKKEAVMNAVNEQVTEYEIVAKPGSTLEKLQHIVGIADGPGDLSTNPKYMEDFGKDSLS